MDIRYATPEDAKLISELGARTFYEAFAQDNSPESMEAYLRDSFSPAIQFRELSEPDSVFLIAELSANPIGYAQLVVNSTAEVIRGRKPLELRRIYASREYVGQGVGKALMKATIEEARQRGCDCVWLGVWEKNQRAIEFYKKWGFHVVGTHPFVLGADQQNDFIMELELR